MLLARKNRAISSNLSNILKNQHKFGRFLCSNPDDPKSYKNQDEYDKYHKQLKDVHPAERTLKILKNDMIDMKNKFKQKVQFIKDVTGLNDDHVKPGTVSPAADIVLNRQVDTRENFQVTNEIF